MLQRKWTIVPLYITTNHYHTNLIWQIHFQIEKTCYYWALVQEHRVHGFYYWLLTRTNKARASNSKRTHSTLPAFENNMIEKNQDNLVHHHDHMINRTHATHNWHLHSCTENISHVPLSLWVHPSASLPLNTMFQLELMQSICQKGGAIRTNITCKASLCKNSYQSWDPTGISWFDSEPFEQK